jgi:hypothetical protein
MQWIKKHWGWVATAGAGLVVFIDPSVQHYAGAHPQSAVVVSTLWSVAMAWARSPRQ